MSKAGQQEFYVVGMSDAARPDFSSEVLDLIARCKVFSGGSRHHEIVADLLPEGARWIEIRVPLDEVFEAYEEEDQVLVFASGDPLFFGFANTLKNRLPDASIKVYPYFNSIQLLAHALLIPYHDMHIVSLTGRAWHELDRALIEQKNKIALLTDRKKTPRAIAQRLLDYNYSDYQIYVGCRLGNKEEEELLSLSLEEASQRDFAFPNCLFLIKTSQNYAAPMGLRDESFMPLNGRQRMITKWPIRLSTLAMLDLHRAKEFWDIGFCTGSVSIEAKLRFPHLEVRAFEIRAEGEELMHVNSRRMKAIGIGHRIGDFLQLDCSDLPSADAVFIGGHGGKLKEILAKLEKRLNKGATLVFNAVSEESKAGFEEAVSSVGMRITERLHMQVDSYNPIEILKAVKD